MRVLNGGGTSAPSFSLFHAARTLSASNLGVIPLRRFSTIRWVSAEQHRDHR
jgi:hypothetical protein